MPKLPQAELDRALRDLPGWSVKDGALTKTYKHTSFAEAIVFVNDLARDPRSGWHHRQGCEPRGAHRGHTP